MNVLLVEDSKTDQLLIKTLLEDVFPLQIVGTMGEALEKVKEGGIDVAFLDLHLPDAVGISIVEKVRGAAPKLPIVVITGQGEGPELDALKAGANEYLIKGTVCKTTLCRGICRAMERQGRKFEQCPLREDCMEIKTTVQGGCPLYDPMMRKLDEADQKLDQLELLKESLRASDTVVIERKKPSDTLRDGERPPYRGG